MIKIFEDFRRYVTDFNSGNKLWSHQEDAQTAFLHAKNGIIEMATGTGKTYTAIQIMKKMLEEGTVRRIIVIAPQFISAIEICHTYLLKSSNIFIISSLLHNSE